MNRRAFIHGMMASGTVLTLSACKVSKSPPPAPAGKAPPASSPPAPAPAPIASVPTLNGVSIDQAEREIRDLLIPEGNWIAQPRQLHTDVTVTSPAEFQTAVTALFNTSSNPQVAGQHHRIQLAWNGSARINGSSATRVNVFLPGNPISHLQHGGSVTIAAAPGYSPAFANTVHIGGQGIIMQGVGFTRATAPGEIVGAVSGALLINSSVQPLEPIIHFQDCYFGHASGHNTMSDFAAAALPTPDLATLANGVSTQGQSRFLSFTDCRFWGVVNCAKIVSRGLRMDGCDFSAMTMDALALFGHTFNSSYTAGAWIGRSTFRDRIDTWEVRNNHVDGIQYCGPMDIHQGIRLLVTDCIMHLAHSFAGDPGMGGGTQGIFGSYSPNSNNQLVVRRTTILSTAPHAFCFYSPKATRPSFVDQCTFFRAGRTPSAFAPDPQPQQDYIVGITGAEGNVPATGNWLLVTETISANQYTSTGAVIETVPVDPRASASVEHRPETIFRGPDFRRGGAPVNGLTQKFGFDLPHERRSQAAFVTNMWANFAPVSPRTAGAPDLRGLRWKT